VTKLNISMPPELLTQIDAEADELGISRSGLIQEASARYIAQSRADRESELRKLRGRAAARRMKEIGEKMGLSGADPVALLAAARAQQDARRG
jgi:metal-responsive CopG/Arc/MetJ family transcriptional regulator